jgi:hypothetical protein|tara:strand:- start:389 stop:643 length:255 start_codon:yes stop_codon:yes gene_type:complete
MSLSRDDYLERAAKLEKETLDKIVKAPVKRGWNSTFRMSIPSINDIKREFNTRLGVINEMCVNAGHKALWEDPDETDVDMQSFE